MFRGPRKSTLVPYPTLAHPRIILVNSNPATIMTDPDVADATYVEPITPEIVEKIIAKESPDALLPTMGGQTALNTALRSEEHTSELQSRQYLVCRLLLEKKK